MSEEGEEVQERIDQVIQRLENIRRPFRERRRRIVNAILGSLERRSYERSRAYRHYNPMPPEEDEVQQLRKEIETLKQQLEEMRRRPRPTVARGE